MLIAEAPSSSSSSISSSSSSSATIVSSAMRCRYSAKRNTAEPSSAGSTGGTLAGGGAGEMSSMAALLSRSRLPCERLIRAAVPPAQAPASTFAAACCYLGQNKRMGRASMADDVRASVKALVFDVFGTVVDWRGSILRELAAFGRERGIAADWDAFVDDWRKGYQPAMQRVRCGELPWAKIDDLHRMILDEVLARFGIRGLSEAETDHLNRAWHRLDPWPDAVPGLTRLKRKFII